MSVPTLVVGAQSTLGGAQLSIVGAQAPTKVYKSTPMGIATDKWSIQRNQLPVWIPWKGDAGGADPWGDWGAADPPPAAEPYSGRALKGSILGGGGAFRPPFRFQKPHIGATNGKQHLIGRWQIYNFYKNIFGSGQYWGHQRSSTIKCCGISYLYNFWTKKHRVIK